MRFTKVSKSVLIRSAVVGAIALGFTANAAPEQSAPAKQGAGEVRRLTVEEVEKLFDTVTAARQSVPRDRFDPEAVIESVGRDPEKLFAWVRDETRWSPYRGCLRGPAGVLADRQGSTLDRSLLLARVLQSAGQRVRLVRGAELSEETARAMVPKLLAAPARDAAQPKSDANAVAKRRVAEETAALLKALPGAAAADHASDAVAALRDYWWVERADVSGAWIAMDLLGVDAKAVGEPRQRIEPASAADAVGFALPADAWHEVVVRVVIEKADQAGALGDATVMENTLRPAELFGRRVRLSNVPLDVKENFDPAADPAKAGVRKSLLEQKEWVPMLQVGKERLYKRSFNAAGEINDRPVVGPHERIGQGANKAFGGFGGALGGSAPEPVAKPGERPQVTAEWLEFEIRVPGATAAAKKVRREVFDLIGPAARAAKSVPASLDDAARVRRALALAGETEIAVIGSAVPADAVAHELVTDLLAAKPAALALAKETNRQAAQTASRQLFDRLPTVSPLDGLRASRFAAGSDATRDVFVDRANVIDVRWTPTLAADDSLGVNITTDVASNYVAVRSATDPAAAFRARVEQGVADTVIEDASLDGFDDSRNTATVFVNARAANVPTVTLGGGSKASLDDVKCVPDVRARLADALAAGYVVVVPAKTVAIGNDAERLGWWRVDPKTGETIGVMDNGFHADTVEYNETTQITTPLQRALRLLETATKKSPHTLLRGGAGRVPGAYDIAELNRIAELQEIAQKLLFQARMSGFFW